MKKVILLISALGSVLFYLLFISKSINICDIYCSSAFDYYHRSLLFFPFVFLFSLITYFAPECVFASWWKFARIAIPAIFIPVLLINLEVHHNPNGDWQDIFDVQILMLLYSIFTIGSVWQIWKGWRSN